MTLKIFIGFANSWEMTVFNMAFQNFGVKTISYNHGLIHEILGYRTNVDLMFATSKHDAKMLSTFSEDKDICLIKVQLKMN